MLTYTIEEIKKDKEEAEGSCPVKSRSPPHQGMSQFSVPESCNWREARVLWWGALKHHNLVNAPSFFKGAYGHLLTVIVHGVKGNTQTFGGLLDIQSELILYLEPTQPHFRVEV